MPRASGTDGAGLLPYFISASTSARNAWDESMVHLAEVSAAKAECDPAQAARRYAAASAQVRSFVTRDPLPIWSKAPF